MHRDNSGRKEKLREALVRKLLAKYHPGIANSKTEALVNDEVDNLMKLMKVTENDLLEVEGKVRKQSNEEIAMISTNPFKRVTSYKSGAKDEWAIMNDLIVKAGFEVRCTTDHSYRCAMSTHHPHPHRPNPGGPPRARARRWHSSSSWTSSSSNVG